MSSVWNGSPSTPGNPLNQTARVGLALSGGAARSLAHIGILKGLAAGGVPVDAIAGTSGGAVVAVLYAAGMPIAEMERVACQLRKRDLGRFSISRMGLVSSRPLRQLLESLIGKVRLEDLQIPTALVATNLVRRERQVFRTGDAIRAALASSSMPHVYRPVEIDGELFTDGGVVEYLPLTALDAYRPLVKIGVHLLPEDQYRSRPRHLGQVLATIVNIIQRANAITSVEEADVILKPAVAPFPAFELENARGLIDAGYHAAKRYSPKILEILEEKQRWLGELGAGHDEAYPPASS